MNQPELERQLSMLNPDLLTGLVRQALTIYPLFDLADEAHGAHALLELARTVNPLFDCPTHVIAHHQAVPGPLAPKGCLSHNVTDLREACG